MADPFEDAAQRLERLADAPRRVATRAAPTLAAVVRAEHAAGRAPDGSAWPLTKDGRVANLALTERTTARADGATILLELDDLLLPSQAGRGRPHRPVVPVEGEALPESWQKPIEDAAREELV